MGRSGDSTGESNKEEGNVNIEILGEDGRKRNRTQEGRKASKLTKLRKGSRK